ncbi:MAG: translation initiation factor IF-2 [Alphaproteobacteria bacterium]|nr:translation initiation factor IF-2 [Alphaproteobacteria bacterium]
MDRREWLSDNEESYKTAFEYLQSGMWTALPAIVTSVDLTKQTISAQSGIKGEFKNAEGQISYINMPVFQDVVLCFPRAGGFAITFPVQPGDEVLLIFACRCIDSWWQSGGINNIVPEFRMHDLSDGFAILAPTSQPKKLSNIPTDSIQITNEDQTKYLEISPDKITVQSDGDVDINAVNINLNGNINQNSDNIYLTATESIHITAPDIYISGSIHV